MKKLLVASVMALAALLQSPANSAVIVTSVGGSAGTLQSAVAGSTYITFGDVGLGTYGSFSSGGFSFTSSNSSAAEIRTGSGNGFDQPFADSSRYLGIFDNNPDRSVTLTLGTDYSKFGLYWGSMNSSDTIVFSNNGVTVFTLNGDDVPGYNGNSNATTSSNRNRYVNMDFTAGWVFDKVVFTAAGSNDFEIDNLALAGGVPELSTWLMMLIGFAGIGLVAYRRNNDGRAVTAST